MQARSMAGNVQQSALLWGAVIATVTGAILWLRQRRAGRNRVPDTWRRVGEISDLLMYPLKSGRAVQLREAQCTSLGLRTTSNSPQELQNLRDRFFVLFNAASGTFVTLRNYSSLLFVTTTSVSDGVFQFDAPGQPPLKLKLPSSHSEKKKISMWFGEEVVTTDCGDEAARWFSTYVKKENMALRLGCHLPDIPRRNVDFKPPYDDIKKFYWRTHSNYTGAFSDLASFMLLSESSLAELKSRLPAELHDIPVHQFRPNLVVRGSQPYEEDSWDWIRIGDHVIMRGFKPCTRCTVTTMDPETGIKEPHLEPLRTMKTFRQVKNARAKRIEGDSPVMGLYLGLHAGVDSSVKIGDPVYVGAS